MTNNPYDFRYNKISIIEDGHYDLTEQYWQDVYDDIQTQHNLNVANIAINHAVNAVTAIIGAADEVFLTTKYGAAFQFLIKLPGAAAEITLQTTKDDANGVWKALIVETGEEFIETSFNIAVGTALAIGSAALIAPAAGIVTTIAVAAAGLGAGELISKVYDNYLEDSIKDALENLIEDDNLNSETSLGLGDGTTQEYRVDTSQTFNSIISGLGVNMSDVVNQNPTFEERVLDLGGGQEVIIYQDGDSIDIGQSSNGYGLGVEVGFADENTGTSKNILHITIHPNQSMPEELGDIFTDPSQAGNLDSISFMDENNPNEPVINLPIYEYHLGDTSEAIGIDSFSGVMPLFFAPPEGGQGFTFSSEQTRANINGNEYGLNDIFRDIGKATNAVTDFISSQAEGVYDYVSDGTGLELSFIQFVDAFSDDFANGTMDVSDAIEEYAKILANNYLQETITEALNEQESRALIERAIREGLDVDAGSSQKLAGSFINSISQMVATFAVQSSGWNSDDFAQAAGAIAANAIFNYAIGEFFGETVAGQVIGDAGVQVITSLINSGEITSEQWESIALTIAFGSVAQTFSGNSLENTVNIVKETIATAVAASTGTGQLGYAVTKLVLNVLQGSIYTGKKFYEGEFGDKGLLLNSIYQVQEIDSGEVDVNGDPIMVDALVATNQAGSTIIMQQGITHLIGGAGSDILVGAETDDVISGGAGSDYLEGKEGDEALFGGAGNDHIVGAEGNDTIQGDDGDDIIFGDAGDDTILGGDGQDFIHGGGGADAILGGLEKDTILASGGDDVVQGDGGDDMIDGGYGDDLLDGGDGNDILLGNLGNDSITAGAGDDKVFGDVGNDQIMGDAGDDYINGGEGIDILEGGVGSDLIYGDSGDDYLQGDLGDDDLIGGTGNDVILGGLDDDYLFGQEGDDALTAGIGNDILVGGLGDDSLTGEEGDDVYILEADDTGIFGEDTIVETEGTNDRVYINGLDATNIADLSLDKNGDDLTISYNSVAIATVANHFVTGADSIERIEFDTDQWIDLSAVTYDVTTGVGTYAVATDTSQTTKADIDLREASINGNLQLQSQFWNSAFLQNLSETAYEEALRDQFENEYYNGGEIIEFKRARGKFGGHYKVYKLETNDQLSGEAELYEYDILEAGYDPNNYDSIITGERVLASNISTLKEGGYNSNLKVYTEDFYDDEQVLIHTLVYNDQQHYDQQSIYGNGYVPDENGVFTLANSPYKGGYIIDENLSSSATRYQNGAITTIDIGENLVGSGADHLVGSWWNETINGNSGDDAIFGGDGDDDITGDAGDDWLFGGDGTDTVNGGTGSDSIFGGGGSDTLNGGDGNDAILAGDGDDIIDGGTGDDWIEAGDGDDTIYGGDGDDIIYGGNGSDTANGGDGTDFLYGQGGNDTLYGDSGSDYLYGGTGKDKLYGNGGDDGLYGEEEDDFLYGGADADLIDGGEGSDTLSYKFSTAAVTINMLNSTASGGYATGDIYSNVERLWGSEFADILTGDDDNAIDGYEGDDIIYGRAGNDDLYGHEGDDLIYGEEGDDAINGGTGIDTASYYGFTEGVTIDMQANNLTSTVTGLQSGSDTLTGIEIVNGTNRADFYTNNTVESYKFYAYSGNDTITGGGGRDYIYGMVGDDTITANAGNDVIVGGDGADNIDGGTGTDTAYYTSSTSGVTINLATGIHAGGEAEGDTLTNIENIYGSAHIDNIKADDVSNTLWGYDGNDKLYGYGDDDILYGGDGNDSLYGLADDDTLYGEDGDDLLIGGTGADILDGGAGDDRVYYTSSSAAVNINLESQTVSGGEADGDTIISIEQAYASAYNDNLIGDANSNIFWGFDGNDTIEGKGGADILYGGDGNDTFVFSDLTHSNDNEQDAIMDFTQGSDLIDLTAFSFTSISDFTISQVSGDTAVNDNSSTFSIKLDGTYTLADADFIFVQW